MMHAGQRGVHNCIYSLHARQLQFGYQREPDQPQQDQRRPSRFVHMHVS